MIVGIVSLLPAFARSVSFERSELSSAASLKSRADESGLSAAEKDLASDAALMSILSSAASVPALSDLVRDIASERGSVRISAVSLRRDASAKAVVAQVGGTAPARNDLLSFKSRLQASIPGSSVDLPLSELAEDKDVRFS
ncbi:MAG: hypothetical protein KGR26_06625, partial [Cyanobacteria bacterium REEB65]|nr:hypothetical protein [Cyanobacteria bacterium REEB65]